VLVQVELQRSALHWERHFVGRQQH
jgi:hypothetical protein